MPAQIKRGLKGDTLDAPEAPFWAVKILRLDQIKRLFVHALHLYPPGVIL